MNIKTTSIVFALLGAILWLTGGHVFGLMPDDWASVVLKLGKLMFAISPVLAVGHFAELVVNQLYENAAATAKAADKIATAKAAATERLLKQREAADAANAARAAAAHDLAVCQAHFTAGTQLDTALYEQIPDLIIGLGRVACAQSKEAATAASSLILQLQRLKVTHDSVSGPGVIAKAKGLIAAFDKACTDYAARQAAETAHNASLTALRTHAA